MKRFHITATGHSLNYLPQYVATKLGYFRDAGLDVTSDVPDPWMQVLKDIDARRAAAALGGVWVPAILNGRTGDYRAFAQMSARCPLVLISRHGVTSFRWADLEGRLVLVTGTGGLGSYVFITGLARRAGVPVGSIRFIRDLEYTFMLDLFLGGLGDYMLVDVPTADRLTREGKVHEVIALFDEHPVPWSVYYAPAAILSEHPERYESFVSALQRGLDWLHNNAFADLEDELRRLWPDYAPSTVIGWLERFRSAGMWQPHAAIDLDALAAWQVMLAAADLIEKPLPPETLVHPKPQALFA